MSKDVSGWVSEEKSKWKLVIYFFEIDQVTGFNKRTVFRSILAEDKKNVELSRGKLLNKFVFHNKYVIFKGEIKTAVMYDNITGVEVGRYHPNPKREQEEREKFNN